MKTASEEVTDMIFRSKWSSQILCAGAELGVFDCLSRDSTRTLSRLVPRLGWSLAAKSSAIESESSDFFGGSPGGVVSWYNLDRLERC